MNEHLVSPNKSESAALMCFYIVEKPVSIEDSYETKNSYIPTILLYFFIFVYVLWSERVFRNMFVK